MSACRPARRPEGESGFGAGSSRRERPERARSRRDEPASVLRNERDDVTLDASGMKIDRVRLGEGRRRLDDHTALEIREPGGFREFELVDAGFDHIK